uniref:Uncharacterized protein n=1 Tax=Pristionchus pacificus TaxID=54126 RepID=A0A2A6CW02_PRIPA|eukprot:PDM82414.1 hypothetical protein PRIPAC_36807 [Pristionchus pacificus]
MHPKRNNLGQTSTGDQIVDMFSTSNFTPCKQSLIGGEHSGKKGKEGKESGLKKRGTARRLATMEEMGQCL